MRDLGYPGESIETHLATNCGRKISPGSDQKNKGGKTFDTFDSKKFSWSFSRERMLKECERKYFYHYIVPSYTADQIDEDLLRNVLFLRKLTNRHLLLGRVIHHMISESIDYFYKNRPVHLAEMINGCWEKYLRALQFSSQQQYLFVQVTHPDFTILFEDIYGVPLDEQGLTRQYQKMKTALRNFYKWFLNNHGEKWIDFKLVEKEQLQSFFIHNVQAWTVIDLLLKNRQSIWYLIDWKLSAFDWEKDCWQLAFYGLYVDQQYSNSQPLKLINFYLSTGYEQSYLWDEQLKFLSRSYFDKSIQHFQAFYRKVNDKYPFRSLQTTAKRQTCWQCNFKSICLSRKNETDKLKNIKHLNDYKKEEGVPSNWIN